MSAYIDWQLTRFALKSSLRPNICFLDIIMASTSYTPDFKFENEAREDGYHIIAGLDEAGRGPLAGPVVAAAVVLDMDDYPKGLNDSKSLSAQKRETLFHDVMTTSHVGIGISSAQYIDETNIRLASLNAMTRAYKALAIRVDFAVIDGRDIPPDFNAPAQAIIKGDARSLSIAAASIIAKVTRDRMMIHYANLFPQYQFEKHMGYGTKAHREAIDKFGACPIHRMSFRPLRQD